MITSEFKVDKVWYRSLLGASGELGAVAAGIVLSEFRDLLYSAPQRSGTYVANFRISVDGFADSYHKMDYRPRKDWWHVGCADAISRAMSSVSGVKEAAVAASQGMSHASIVVSNDTPYADEANSQAGRARNTGYPGDPGNPGTEGHVGRFIDRVSAKLSKRIYVGSSTWSMYKDFGIGDVD